MLHLEASIIDLQLRRSREAKEAIRKRGEQIHDYLGHCAEVCMLQLLHKFKVKRAGLNPTSETGGNGLWKVLLKSIYSKGFGQRNDRRCNAVQCSEALFKVRPFLNVST